MTMLKCFKAAIFLSAVTCLAVATFVYAGSTLASEQEHWVSVDSSELALITNSPELEASLINTRVEKIVSGIAILRLTDEQMEDLSRAMHVAFHKCGGFVEHASEAEAIAWVERMKAVDLDSPQVNYMIDNRTTVTVLQSAARELDTREMIINLSAFPNRRYNQPSGLESAYWIKARWAALAAGRNDTTVEFYNHPTNISPQPSIIMTIRGSRYPDEIVVVGGHQDSINLGGPTLPAPGADDNGSGIACMTEMIRVLMSKSFRPERTVQFMAYAAEEIGLRGSAAIANQYRTENRNVVGVFQLDMTNYRGTLGYDIVIFTDYTNAAQNQFLRDLITAYQPGMLVGSSSCGYACSDHASWTNRGYPASFPFEATFNDDNPSIHTANDTIAMSNNNADHAHKFTKLGLSYVAELAKGCLSRRLPCASSQHERPAVKLLSSMKADSGSLLVDAAAF